MEISPKEMRKMLNAAWDAGSRREHYIGAIDHYPLRHLAAIRGNRSTRYRDVSRILEAKKKEGKKDG